MSAHDSRGEIYGMLPESFSRLRDLVRRDDLEEIRIRVGKNVQLAYVEKFGGNAPELDVVEVQVADELVALLVAQVAVEHARGQGAVVQGFQEQGNAELVRRYVGVE